ncbi:hypothetical protein HPB47_004592 [Ixodes persulcatus]|uniref:Uncharacterized protein n=1 Tax=Ixodes persulcatus TaxID=34615 RepID=A0AC60PF95_IXOPE|nr:hypothetical protein HPB47_004592 [Ixodes persulcatus]
MLLGGLWFGAGHRDMVLFLNQFVQEIVRIGPELNEEHSEQEHLLQKLDRHFQQERARHAHHFRRLAARFPPRRERASVTTWTVLVEDRPVGWASALRWREQPRPERGAPPETIPEPFRGNTLEDRHLHEPAAVARVAADWARRAAPPPAAPPAAPRPLEVAEAIRVLRQVRPDLLHDPAHEEAILDLDL